MAKQMWIRGENGAVHLFDLPLPLGIAKRLDRGDLARVEADGSPWVERDEPEPAEVVEVPDAPPLPKRAESRAVWAQFAVSQGMPRAEAATATKADLIALLTGGTTE
jgi:hypothetical protein